jgi:Glycosyl transferase family 2
MTAQTRISSRVAHASVVIPTLNEARNLPHVLAKLPLDVHEVIVVDGHPVGDTAAVTGRLRPDTRIVTQTRTGEGNALAGCCAAAIGDTIAVSRCRWLSRSRRDSPVRAGTHRQRRLRGEHQVRARQEQQRHHPATGTTQPPALPVRQPPPRHSLHRPMLWLQRLLAATGPSAGAGCYREGAAWGRAAVGDGFEVETLIHIRVVDAGLMVTEVPSFGHSRIQGGQLDCGQRRPAGTADDHDRAPQAQPERTGLGNTDAQRRDRHQPSSRLLTWPVLVRQSVSQEWVSLEGAAQVTAE